MPSVLLGRDRIVPIVVPAPSRFCVHKLAVYGLRRPSESAKRAKDLGQAVLLAEALVPESADELERAIDAAPKALRMKARAAARLAVDAFERAPEAADLVERLAGNARARRAVNRGTGGAPSPTGVSTRATAGSTRRA
jgi:hypothetical protein